MPRAAVVGIGATPLRSYRDTLEHELLIPALLEAVADAGIEKGQIQSLVFTTPRPHTAQRYFGTFIAGYLELPVTDLLVEVLGNGMTGGLAFDLAVERITAGRASVAIALGVSRETHIATAEHHTWTMRAVGDVDYHTPLGVVPIAWYALNATRYMHEYGVGRADLAAIAVKNRANAGLNPLAHFRDPITIEDVLSSRPVVRPLHMLDVPPRSDGAVAVVIAEETLARRLRPDPVWVTGRGFYHEGVHQVASKPRSLVDYPSARIAASVAYAGAGLGSENIGVAELYAPCTIVEAILSEAVGFFPTGEGARAAVAGLTRLDGQVAISPSGGCLSRGHAPHVTPLYNVVESVIQLRGAAGERQVPSAMTALVTAELGDYNCTLAHVLQV